ncbi:hypothetical protein CRM22_003009 [Opisthorchis felineus]|uniref:Uncharacterized protein n=1 Tax=Opisthorchis felineus TaxID=147828 RepID=A0A4S2M3B7_OPIFE|nr:hypothetical protein CRM22_003009 [Opisthorchis felineus]
MSWLIAPGDTMCGYLKIHGLDSISVTVPLMIRNICAVFREHQNKCLLNKEEASEQCTVVRNHTIREVVTALQNMSTSVSAGSSEYYRSVQATLARYECR